jgi:dihydroflavonol-4-reductase
MIFITGSNGLIGSFIVRKLLSHNHTIRALCRKNSDLGLLKDVAHKIEWVEGDITDVRSLEKNLEGIKTVIHAAAIVSFAPSEKNKMFQVNIEGTANVVNAALHNKVDQFVHISSVAALGRRKNLPLVDENIYWENSSYNTNYATSKYFAELEVWRGMEEGLNGFIVNPSVVMGPGNWNEGSTKIFKYLWDESLFYSAGEMNFIDVRDVSDIIYRLMSEEKANRERFLLNASQMPYKEVFYKIADEFGKKRPKFEAGPLLSEFAWRFEALKSMVTGKNPLITKETAKLSRHSFVYDTTKIRKLLNYEFTRPEDTIEWACKELVNKYGV